MLANSRASGSLSCSYTFANGVASSDHWVRLAASIALSCTVSGLCRELVRICRVLGSAFSPDAIAILINKKGSLHFFGGKPDAVSTNAITAVRNTTLSGDELTIFNATYGRNQRPSDDVVRTLAQQYKVSEPAMRLTLKGFQVLLLNAYPSREDPGLNR